MNDEQCTQALRKALVAIRQGCSELIGQGYPGEEMFKACRKEAARGQRDLDRNEPGFAVKRLLAAVRMKVKGEVAQR